MVFISSAVRHNLHFWIEFFLVNLLLVTRWDNLLAYAGVFAQKFWNFSTQGEKYYFLQSDMCMKTWKNLVWMEGTFGGHMDWSKSNFLFRFRSRSNFSKFISTIDFSDFLMFDSIWIQSHMQATSQQSEILHSWYFLVTIYKSVVWFKYLKFL